jgi:hypothetical protein
MPQEGAIEIGLYDSESEGVSYQSLLEHFGITYKDFAN